MKSLDVIPTGSIALDLALGLGGIPRGVITEIYGPPSSGKSTLTLHIIAQAQHKGLGCVFIDMENGLNPAYAVRCGVDDDRLLLAQPQTGNEALEMCHSLLHSQKVNLVVIDSIAALASQEEIRKGMGSSGWGYLNRLLSPHLRKIEKSCQQSQGTLICTNQIRSRIKPGYGTPETTPGGMTVKLHAALRIELQIKGYIQEAGNIAGVKIQAEVNKNRLGPSKRRTTLDIVYNRGVSRERELFSLGMKENLITRQGSTYRFQSQYLGQGQRAVEEFLGYRREVAQALEDAIRLSLVSKTT
ncbi:MAG: DNA recombination/repair protein RecA [Anaerolineales bacterium]